jgi:hypothetical protein
MPPLFIALRVVFFGAIFAFLDCSRRLQAARHQVPEKDGVEAIRTANLNLPVNDGYCPVAVAFWGEVG